MLAQTACDRGTPATAAGGVVSLSPAATDLILAMNAGDLLVGVSTYDADARVSALPKLGDYENVDWERIAALKPKHLFVQIAPDRMPPGFESRAIQSAIELHTVRIDRFTDIIVEAERIGAVLERPDAARTLWQSLRERVDTVQTTLATRPVVKTLIVVSDDGLNVAGPETFLDDALDFAGGVNVLTTDRSGYTKIDRELLEALAPDAIVVLAPGAVGQRKQAVETFWKSPNAPAVKNNRVLIVTDDWCLMPGAHFADLVERVARHLHPEAF
jgi:iron complex transport system substrate-binding protein